MKKYAIILLVLILIGLALTVRLLTQEQRLDQTVFLQTTESIRNLQALDKNLALLLNQSLYNASFEHARLTDTNYQISEEFDNLRFEALFEEIEGSPNLSDAVAKFEEQFIEREETLDAYVEGNTAISKSLAAINTATKQLNQKLRATQNAGSKQNEGRQNPTQVTNLNSVLASINAEVYRLALGGDLNEKNNENNHLSELIDTFIQQPAVLKKLEINNLDDVLETYKSAFTVILENHQATKTQLNSLAALETGPLLDSIEEEYTAYHNQAISGSNQFRNALIIYGVCSLGALLFFAFQIRKNYVSLEQQVADRTAEIKTAYNDLQESQEQLIQSEKMASLGQMVAGVAHEINTPLGYVTSNIDTLKLNLDDINEVIQNFGTIVDAANSPTRDNKEVTRRLVNTIKTYKNIEAPELVGETQQLLNDGAYGLSEITTLVTSLKDFARLDRQNTEQVDIHNCLNSSITIASNHIRENKVVIKTKYRELPKIDCFPSKLNQLFLNIITNACQAMSENGGKLSINTSLVDDNIQITFADQGVGMDEQTKQKMFDPFFTSKEIGSGTGLGMSIAYKIIEAHNGSIEVDTALGIGTKVAVSLPLTRSAVPA